MRYDMIVRGGWVVLPEGVQRLTIAVSDGLIAELAPEVGGAGAEEVDASGLLVLPAMIDAHVHFNEPGRADWEGLATGSAAIAAGGGSCYLDMPLNSSPPTTDRAALNLKRAAAEERSITDFGLWGGLVPGNLDRLEELADGGVVGFKAFMASSGISDFERADDLTLLDGMTVAARLGLPVAVHAESEELTCALGARVRRGGGTRVRDYLASRPIVAEVEAIGRAIALAEETGCSLHVVHVSSARGVRAVADARRRGVDVTCETCPHYLVLVDEDMDRLRGAAKCAPPLRPASEVEALWVRLIAGDVQLVASDHSPALPSMKMADDFFEVWGGIAGCQSTLAILLAAGHRAHGLPLPHLAELVSAAPARRFRLGGKGILAPGRDADLVLVDPDAHAVLRAEDLQYRHAISPYLGRPLHGFVRRTMVRGRTVFADGRPTGERAARMVRPAP